MSARRAARHGAVMKLKILLVLWALALQPDVRSCVKAQTVAL
jgi:hypothetical protein